MTMGPDSEHCNLNPSESRVRLNGTHALLVSSARSRYGHSFAFRAPQQPSPSYTYLKIGSEYVD